MGILPMSSLLSLLFIRKRRKTEETKDHGQDGHATHYGFPKLETGTRRRSAASAKPLASGVADGRGDGVFGRDHVHGAVGLAGVLEAPALGQARAGAGVAADSAVQRLARLP
jgi:hypothetical protein